MLGDNESAGALSCVFMFHCRMPKGRLATAAQRSCSRQVEPEVVNRRSGRDKVQTEKGSQYTAALRSGNQQKRATPPQPGTSGVSAKNTAKASKHKGNGDNRDESAAEVESDSDHSDSELSEMLARAKVAMSVIDKLADKLK